MTQLKKSKLILCAILCLLALTNMQPCYSQSNNLSISGPRQGVDGSKYTVSNGATVQWTTDSSKVATIDQSGVLKVVGNGLVNITATENNTTKATMEVLVGDPTFVLGGVSNISDNYIVNAKCTNAKIADFLNKYSDVISYKWGVKMNNKQLTWTTSDSQQFKLSVTSTDGNVTVYFKTVDLSGNESNPLFIRISGDDIYKLGYKTLVFNSKGELYDEEGAKLFYDYTTMPLQQWDRSKSYDAGYSPVSAVAVNNEHNSSNITWERRGYVHDIISSTEKNKIINSIDGSVHLYSLKLINCNNKVIQESPVIIIYKANFPQ